MAFEVQPRLPEIDGLDCRGRGLCHVCELRATRIDDEAHVVFAADTAGGAETTIDRLLADCRIE